MHEGAEQRSALLMVETLLRLNGEHYLPYQLDLRLYYMKIKHKNTYSILWASYFLVLKQVIFRVCIFVGYIFLYQDEAKCKKITIMKREAKVLRFLSIMYFYNRCSSWLGQKPINRQGISVMVFLQWLFIISWHFKPYLGACMYVYIHT